MTTMAEFLDAVKGLPAHHVAKCLNIQTPGRDWTGATKHRMGYAAEHDMGHVKLNLVKLRADVRARMPKLDWNALTPEQQGATLRTMRDYGGGFVGKLADLWNVADGHHSRILGLAFRDIVHDYGPGSAFYEQSQTGRAATIRSRKAGITTGD